MVDGLSFVKRDFFKVCTGNVRLLSFTGNDDWEVFVRCEVSLVLTEVLRRMNILKSNALRIK